MELMEEGELEQEEVKEPVVETHDYIWDDSVLINAYNDAIHEYMEFHNDEKPPPNGQSKRKQKRESNKRKTQNRQKKSQQEKKSFKEEVLSEDTSIISKKESSVPSNIKPVVPVLENRALPSSGAVQEGLMSPEQKANQLLASMEESNIATNQESNHNSTTEYQYYHPNQYYHNPQVYQPHHHPHSMHHFHPYSAPRQPASTPVPPPLPPHLSEDDSLSKLLLSWYYSGYYAGQYQLLHEKHSEHK